MALVVDGGAVHAPKRKVPPPGLNVGKGPCSEPVVRVADNLFHTNLGRGPIGTAAQCEIGTDSGVDVSSMASVGPLEGSEVGARNACAVAGESLSKDCEVFGEHNGGRELQAW